MMTIFITYLCNENQPKTSTLTIFSERYFLYTERKDDVRFLGAQVTISANCIQFWMHVI